MAPKKKDKEKISEGARAVGKAAENLLKVPMSDEHYRNEWGQTVGDVDAMDKAFNAEEATQKESLMDFLRAKLRSGETEVRVLQIGPQGSLIDVSDKVNAKDLSPENIGGVQTEDGRNLPLSRNPQSREAAFRVLQEIVPGLQPSGSKTTSRKSESIRRMELVLKESDKILEHWKK